MLIPLEAEVESLHASAAAFLRPQSSSLPDHQHPAGRDRARLFDPEQFKRKFVTTLADLRGELGFRIVGDDAKTLRRESATIQPASSFQDLSDYKTFVRTMSAEPGRPGHPQGPITVKTFPAFGCQGTDITNLHFLWFPKTLSGQRSLVGQFGVVAASLPRHVAA